MTTNFQRPAAAQDSGPAVPEVVVQRLPLYVRVLTQFERQGVPVVSSEQLGTHLQMTPAQIRKDLSYFGKFGKQGRGYNVSRLCVELRHILGLDSSWNAAIIGMGRLGRAIAAYPGFERERFKIVAAFDADPAAAGNTIGPLVIQPMSEIGATVAARRIEVGIVAVPASQAQQVIDLLVAAGVKGILNYAPYSPQVPAGVRVQSIDPVLALQSMTYYLKR
jgi:redox-sensing transcriptional repressor